MSDFAVYNNIGRMFPQPSGVRPEGTGGDAFGNVLKDALNEVHELEKGIQAEMQKVMTDENGLHNVMVSLEKADLSFQVMMQVRNKIMEAYQEIMRTQV
jgi:flagellar hook-basal body complex protein FliE